jgi:parallel beta-helix repeat protein
MNRKALGIILLILFSLCPLYVKSAQSQSQNSLIINADGTITPTTVLVQQESDTYTLMGDFRENILIQRSNIIFEGAGRLIQGSSIKLLDVTNVTIRNLTISGLPHGSRFGIVLENAEDCRVTNCTITDVWSFLGLNGISYDGIYVSGGGSNVFTKNTLVNNSLGMHFESTVNNIIAENFFSYIHHSVDSSVSGILFNNANGNIIYHNNFRTQYGAPVAASNSNNTWDNGYPDGGNFWLDYRTYHPNATEIDYSGLGSEPYIINAENRDNYPLLEPFNATAYPEVSPTPDTSVGSGETGMPSDLAVLVIGAALVVVLAVAGLIIFFRRRRH